ncbi:MAG: YcxB family protein [Bacteroidia bacterium]
MILEENDYLQHQLFLASVSPLKIRNRKRSRYINSGLIFIWSIIAYINDNIGLAIYFGIAALLFFIAFPYYSRWFHKRHYTKYIQEHFRNRFGKNITFEFREEQLYSSNDSGEGSIKYSEIEMMYETAAYYIINFNDGNSFLIAKNKINNLKEVQSKIQELHENLGLPLVQQLDWVWK